MAVNSTSLARMYISLATSAPAPWDEIHAAVGDFVLDFWNTAHPYLDGALRFTCGMSHSKEPAVDIYTRLDKITIREAEVVSSEPGQPINGWKCQQFEFRVPLNHEDPEAGTLGLRAESHFDDGQAREKTPYFVYLVGGPGSENDPSRMTNFTRYMIQHRYQVLFLNYRGTGPSDGFSHLAEINDVKGQVDHLKLFRQDNIVRDLEAVRKGLSVEKWSLWGQSFGGWVALTYLSFYPEALEEVFLTGGMAPINKTPRDVYKATYAKVSEFNKRYFATYGEDQSLLRRVVQKLCALPGAGVKLPNGGLLTAQRLMGIGRALGSSNGFATVHCMLHDIDGELDKLKPSEGLSKKLGAEFESCIKYENRPLYAILHESIYCYGSDIESDWAAERVGCELPEFRWLKSDFVQAAARGHDLATPLYFSGEMVYPFLFKVYPGLEKFKDVAEELAHKRDWTKLYDEEQLQRNTVPVYAAMYDLDMYVDLSLSREAGAKIGNLRMVELPNMLHDTIREDTEKVIDQLFQLRPTRAS